MSLTWPHRKDVHTFKMYTLNYVYCGLASKYYHTNYNCPKVSRSDFLFWLSKLLTQHMVCLILQAASAAATGRT